MRNNRKIKTTSFNFRGEDYYYCLGINYDFTILAETQVVLENMNMVGEELNIMVDQNYLSQMLESILIQVGISG